MPQCYFTIRQADRVEDDVHGEFLPDNAAALNVACRMARELQAARSDSDPGLVVVKNEKHHTVLSIPFLAGFARVAVKGKVSIGTPLTRRSRAVHAEVNALGLR